MLPSVIRLLYCTATTLQKYICYPLGCSEKILLLIETYFPHIIRRIETSTNLILIIGKVERSIVIIVVVVKVLHVISQDEQETKNGWI